MKTKTIITEINHNDLVNLFSTATYGSNWLMIRKPNGSYKGTALEDENDTAEDSWAKVLLNGGAIYCYDNYAEDENEFYGNLPHKFTDYGMRYEVTLQDVIKGLEKACDDGGYGAECFNDLCNDDACNLDLTEAENLLQIITFGEAIYG